MPRESPRARAKAAAVRPASRRLRAGSTRPIKDLDKPEWYFNRELSWIEFNQRVLEEAQNPDNPPLERLKFLAIASSNLDEFFEIRVAGLQQQMESQPQAAGPDGLNPAQTLDALAVRVRRLVEDQYRCYATGVVPALAAAGIDLFTVADLEPKAQAWAKVYFDTEVFPVLTPLAVDPAHPFPQLSNKTLNLAVELRVLNIPGQMDGMQSDGRHTEYRLGLVQVPRLLPRLLEVPAKYCREGRRTYLFLSSLISAHTGQLFPGLEVLGCYAFRVTRNSELYLDEDEADNLMDAMSEQLTRRKRGDAVRLEVQRGCDASVVKSLLTTFELDSQDLYEVDGPINLTRLMAIYAAEKRPDLKDAAFVPAIPQALRGVTNSAEFFAALRLGDIVLHHPYESFHPVVQFIEYAAEDRNVLAIKMTLYRTSEDSPIVRALMRAAENGKQVTALVELKARFDEENNITWARAMEAAGVHVVYGLVGLKTHSKLALVVRREGKNICRYVHLGTGNYNEVTAHIYTDIGLLTHDNAIGEDASKIFNLLTGMSQYPGLKCLVMAPFGLDKELIKRIDREAAHARKAARTGQKAPAMAPRIVAKMNSLVDPSLIKALYRASQAGVQIDLIIRGICCLRPGVPRLSENIRVRSIVGRFLEHSRVFYFANNGNEDVWCGSADWMPRNFYRRVEVVYPLLDKHLKQRVKNEVLMAALADNQKARELRPDGTYPLVKRAAQAPVRAYQDELLAHFREVQVQERTNAPASHALAERGLFTLTPRPAPAAFAGHDGLPGTGADPVLLSLQQSLQGQSQSKDADPPARDSKGKTTSEA